MRCTGTNVCTRTVRLRFGSGQHSVMKANAEGRLLTLTVPGGKIELPLFGEVLTAGVDSNCTIVCVKAILAPWPSLLDPDEVHCRCFASHAWIRKPTRTSALPITPRRYLWILRHSPFANGAGRFIGRTMARPC